MAVFVLVGTIGIKCAPIGASYRRYKHKDSYKGYRPLLCWASGDAYFYYFNRRALEIYSYYTYKASSESFVVKRYDTACARYS